MSLLAVKRKFIISLTILMVVLSWGGALVFHTLLPRYYFAWYPSIPIFFYLFGLFYIFMFGYCYRVSPQKMVANYLIAKVPEHKYVKEAEKIKKYRYGRIQAK